MTPAEFKAARMTCGPNGALTQSEWAAWLGLHRVTVGNIETGKAPITPTVALLVEAIMQGYRPAEAGASSSSASREE
jgi:DNA-binding XRE family transcriptional regulator